MGAFCVPKSNRAMMRDTGRRIRIKSPANITDKNVKNDLILGLANWEDIR